ncbi:hormogonium polysaccharide secretion pseudopilin HpsB [Gloeocapsopsis dulcis]|uniref:Prepilin-type cleavage/methylation domain-containing protein n=1 Tax=Gloeocapsopsis dulcis AAB1 = 1H9 TaxID=1433147 RepID=A0A6N8FVH3_9CHRO|nr:hormogonium polysaccharide secretion pseudopilin HpsB [Gloeocapsopsis dulcis]MUL36941.1 prepilin-type cleavage/methylation domain-containing protein [Gloeocapsopsis dulcis AAB1 = 1H9]WNN88757.1 hormogonium polysaccharide secretion pseudopilin HpsB [Gloeocapsopsis dulcis]
MIKHRVKQYLAQNSQSGFTIIESLMAVIVVGILMSAIAPAIALSVATRVQARRVELASQAARTYIDGIRSGTITPPSTTIERSTTQYFLDSVDPPTASAAGLASLHCVSLDETSGCSSTSSKDLVIQAVRSVTSTSTDADKGYRLGLRVYRADAFSDSTALQKGTKQATFTGGLGDRKKPLVEMTTEITTAKTTFQDFCDRLGGC